MSKKDKHQQEQPTDVIVEEKPTHEEVIEMIATPSAEQRIQALEEALKKLTETVGDPSKVDRRGRPVSQREMSDADARSVMIGEHRELSHKLAAEKTGLSYGQVYSARLGFTFKHIRKEMLEAGKTDIWTAKK